MASRSSCCATPDGRLRGQSRRPIDRGAADALERFVSSAIAASRKSPSSVVLTAKASHDNRLAW